ncbi:MAG: hypothetical protein ACI9WC_002426 [Arenicella sp.]
MVRRRYLVLLHHLFCDFYVLLPLFFSSLV